jgi:hypothetical protein
LDTVEGLVKTVDVSDKTIWRGKADLIFQNARCKKRMRKLCVFQDGIYLFRLVIIIIIIISSPGYQIFCYRDTENYR